MATITADIDLLNTAGVDPALADQLVELTEYAVALWAAVLAGAPTTWRIRLEITTAVPSGRADGGPGSTVAVGSVDNSANAFEGAPSVELRSGVNVNGAGYDISLRFHPDYLANNLWLDPTPGTSNDLVAGKVDALSVLVHEIGHALAFTGFYNDTTDTFDFGAKTPYDYRRDFSGPEQVFDGPNVRAVLGGPAPLTTGNSGHYGNTVAPPGADPLNGLMNGTTYYTGVRYTISDLDLAFLADTGTGTIRDDIFDQQWLPQLRGGAGNDVFRASYAATLTSITFVGGLATVQAPGTVLYDIERFEIVFGQAADTITGGGYDDVLAGGGGADRLTGGAGADRFIIRNASDIAGAGDRITDFFGDPDIITGSPYSGVNDLLDFSALTTASFIGSNPFTLASGQLRYAFVGGDTQVQLDANGDGAIDGLVTLAGFNFTLAETAPGSLVLIALSMSAPDDYPATTATTGIVAPGAPASGAIENDGDRDWFKVTLTAGRTYQFDLVTSGSGIDPLLKLYSAGGVLIATYNDGGAGSNSRGQFTPSASGSYYLEASSEAASIGLPGAGSTGSYTLSVTDLSGDAAAPLLVGSAPADNAVGVSSTANLVLTFNEAVKAGAGAIEIRRLSDGGLFESIAVTNSARASFSGATVTINPNGTFAAGAGYYVVAAAGVIQDLAGNAFAGIAGIMTLNFTVQSAGGASAPTLIGSSPADNANGVSATADIVLTFSEAVQAGAGAFEIRRASDGGLFEALSVNDASRVTISGAQVTLNPAGAFTLGAGYYVVAAAGVVKDLAGDAFGGISGQSTLNFTAQAPTTAWTLAIPDGGAIYGTGQSDAIEGTAGDDIVGGGGGGDALLGGDGLDRMYGEAGADTLVGGENDDFLYGGDGADVLDGGVGFDFLVGGPGDDTLLGGADFDLVSYERAAGGVTVSLAIGGPQGVGGGEGVDTLSGLEGLIGGAFADNLTGDANDNFLEGRGGNDVLNGGGGFDRGYYRFAAEGVSVDLRITGSQFISASEGSDTLISIEALTGSHFGDVLRGDAGNNSLHGRLGDDLFSGGGGNDQIIGDQGEDTLELTGPSSAYTVSVNGQGQTVVTDTRPGAPDGAATLSGVELLKFTDQTVRIAPTASYGVEFGLAPAVVGEADAGLSAWVGEILRIGPATTSANYNWIVRATGANPAQAAEFVGGVLASGTLGFLPGETSFTLAIPLVGNLAQDGDRTFELVITTPDGPLIKLITIADNDVPTPQTPTGGAAGDQLFGGQADDSLQGLGGDDRLSGGGGTDKALYAGSAKDYAWWQADDGAWRVQDLRPGSPEGTDTLTFIEQLVFADRTIKLSGATTAEALGLAFEQVMRIAAPAAADAAFLSGLIAAVDSGGKSLEAAYGEIVQRADGTTAVAAMAYQFFLGFAPSKGGFDYLVSPTGPNPNNLNAAYYQDFNTENRYINFAVNLGKVGEGRAAFEAEYGGLTLRQATAEAYEAIFGGAPSEAFLSLLLDADVGGGLTRKDYFAVYGGDGLSGVGTKAAMVGWLLTEAAKADIGLFARASNAYLQDLADGAEFRVDMIGVYAQPDWVHQPPG